MNLYIYWSRRRDGKRPHTLALRKKKKRARITLYVAGNKPTVIDDVLASMV